MSGGPQVGEPAPDFELPGTAGSFRLSDHRGERVLLLFYPGDNTPVCTKQFCSYRDDESKIMELDATIVGISTQDVGSHERFTSHHGLKIPLLADTGGKIAKAYGVGSRIMGTKRSVFIIDPEGKLAFRHVHALSLTFMDSAALGEALATVPPPARVTP